jgi:ferrochelatase
MIDNVRAALHRAGVSGREPNVRVLFSAHSIPTSMARSCDYVAQLAEASHLVAEGAGVARHEIVYQSRSGPPTVPWLEPDVGDRIDALATQGVTTVVVVPIGFISDHMEVVYDLDTLAAQRARARGMRFERASTVGVDPRFVRMIRELVQERLDPTHPRRALGTLGVRPDRCAAGCCPAPARPR